MKPIIAGIGNNGEYNYVIFLKSGGLLTLLAKFLIGVGEEPCCVEAMITDKGICETEELKSKEELKPADIKKMIDRRFNFSGENFNVDIIFGKERVFLIAYLSPEKRDIMRKTLLSQCEFIKPR